MESKNNEQNSVIFQIADIVNRMSSQVNFLIRKDLLMSQLDVDIMMENTRKLYNTLCSVKCNMDVDSIPMEIENENASTVETVEAVNDEIVEKEMSIDSLGILTFDVEGEDEDEGQGEGQGEDQDQDQDHGDGEVEMVEEVEEEVEEEKVEVEVEEEKVKVEVEVDKEDDDDDYRYNPEEDSGIRTYIKSSKEETQTIAEKLELKEDSSLAARLQRKPITDLMAAIGINDKFLLLNELFNGSMEKYNKSIRALNSFSTLFGAKTYMSELQIELQWDCESAAYKKLVDLVERRFI